LRLRSMLFAPASHERHALKALSGEAGADAAILDLEDAVRPADKPEARARIRRWLGDRAGGPPAWVRINAMSTPFAYEDLVGVVGPGLAGIVLPKVETGAEVATADWLLTHLERLAGLPAGSVALMPSVETATGLAAVASIAVAAPARARRIMFGALDFSLDTGMAPAAGREGILWARAQLAIACRAAGMLPPIDTVYPDLPDTEGLRAEAEQARRLGFGGKACVHPRQVAVVHAAFAPTPAEVDRARRVLEAFAAAGEGAIRVDGQLVDEPVVARARQVLGEAGLGGPDTA
jgi:citrate lyase subunit beta/citryl-CoA lyase